MHTYQARVMGVWLPFIVAGVVLGQGAGIEWEILNEEALDLQRAGRYDRALLVAKKALEVAEKNVGRDHPDVVVSLNTLVGLYVEQGLYAQAEPLCERALAIKENTLPIDHPSIAASLNILAGLYHVQGKYGQAEPLYKNVFHKVTFPGLRR